MLKPQQILKDYKGDRFLEKNTVLLSPVYQELFNNLVMKSVDISPEVINAVEVLNNYFNSIFNIAKKRKLTIRGDSKEDNKSVGKIIELVPSKKIDEAVLALNILVKFIKQQRTNVNNLSFFIWSLLGETRIEDIPKNYLDKPDQLKEALLNPVFVLLILKYINFGPLILQDFLMPVELKNPTRMKGSFGEKVFAIIFSEIKQKIISFRYAPNVSVKELAKLNDWYFTESASKRLKFPTSKRGSKQVDMVCKVASLLFICSHKEQNQGGGGQDNQAEDAGSIFEYDEKIIKKIKSVYKVKKVYFCIFLEGSGEVIKSNHWTGITAKITAKGNKDKYLLNSFQFIQLIKTL